MVCRTGLLLIACGCHAVDLGIVVPPKGEAAITAEDIARDGYQLSVLGESSQKSAYIGKRLEKMNLSVDVQDSSICGYRGAPAHHSIVIHTDSPSELDAIGPWLVALAKAVAHRENDDLSICLEWGGPTLVASSMVTAKIQPFDNESSQRHYIVPLPKDSGDSIESTLDGLRQVVTSELLPPP